MRSPRSPGSAGPSKTSSIAMGAGITARRRPMSAAGGAAPGALVIVWRRFVPSMSMRTVAARGSRSGAGIEPIVRATGRPATIGRVSLLLLVDLDGVVYRGTDPVPGVAAVLADRAARGDDIVYVTNNSMHYRADYVTRLSAMGAPVTQDRVVSSARATALYARDHESGIRRVLVLGASGLERELRDVGLDVVTAAQVATRMS